MQLRENITPSYRPSPTVRRALVVAGDDKLRAAIADSVRSHGFDVTPARDGLDALAELTEADAGGPLYDLVVTARDLPDMTGRTLCDTVTHTFGMTPQVIALP